MPFIISPTITAFTTDDFNNQKQRLTNLSSSLHIDLMDGVFAPTLSPAIDKISLVEGVNNDIHLMFQQPSQHIDELIKLHPTSVIVHYESEGDLIKLAGDLKASGIKPGLALLPHTEVSKVTDMLAYFDEVLIFSGKLGYHGGTADLQLTDKARYLRRTYPDLVISWDGGINADNITELAKAGVNKFNVGGYIASAADPKQTMRILKDRLSSL
ncbi:MAG TPA: hypothetical protein VFN51_00615 [Candidatus Saccharimonadales bacterium]|nr:hypothetical protein [Candidatus Saccharimonadales bacterium]